jgi:hypothetical protein
MCRCRSLKGVSGRRVHLLLCCRLQNETLLEDLYHLHLPAEFDQLLVRTDGALSGYAWCVERKRVLLDREATA